MRFVVAAVAFALGCSGGRELAGEEDARDGVVHEGAHPGDGDVDDPITGDAIPGTDGDDDAAAEGDSDAVAADDADADADADAPPPLPGCPDTLAGDGPVALVVRWRHQEPWGWASPGSGGVAVRNGVVVAAQPSSPWVEGSEPWGVWLDAETGTPMPYERDRLLRGMRAVDATVHGDEMEFAGVLPPCGDTPADLEGVRALSDGTVDPSWGASGAGIGLSIAEASSLRIVATNPDDPHSTEHLLLLHGRTADGGWRIEGMSESMAASIDLHDAAEDDGEGFVAVGLYQEYWIPRSDVRILWTTPRALHLTNGLVETVASMALDAPSRFVPVAAIVPTARGSDYLLARRSDDLAAGVGLWIERRRADDLAVVSSHDLRAYETAVDRPEPRELQGRDDAFALAWVAGRRAPDDRESLCLYATPLDTSGAMAGPAVRVDDAALDTVVPPVEHVRMFADHGAYYLLWRREPDLWLARVDAGT